VFSDTGPDVAGGGSVKSEPSASSSSSSAFFGAEGGFGGMTVRPGLFAAGAGLGAVFAGGVGGFGWAGLSGAFATGFTAVSDGFFAGGSGGFGTGLTAVSDCFFATGSGGFGTGFTAVSDGFFATGSGAGFGGGTVGGTGAVATGTPPGGVAVEPGSVSAELGGGVPAASDFAVTVKVLRHDGVAHVTGFPIIRSFSRYGAWQFGHSVSMICMGGPARLGPDWLSHYRRDARARQSV
jgi:hypothetical protein